MVKKSGIAYHKPSEGYWEIPGIDYRGETHTYRVFEKMAPVMNHDNLVEYSMGEKQKGNPYIGDSILTFATMSVAYNLRKKHSEEIEMFRKFLQSGLKQYPGTLTRIIYNPQGEDEIIHNYKTSDEYILNDKVVGSDGWIKDIPDKKILKSLLGIDNIKRINEISQWINNTNTYLWRLNSKPLQKNERVVGFDACLDGLYLLCDRLPAYLYPAFRVLKVE